MIPSSSSNKSRNWGLLIFGLFFVVGLVLWKFSSISIRLGASSQKEMRGNVWGGGQIIRGEIDQIRITEKKTSIFSKDMLRLAAKESCKVELLSGVNLGIKGKGQITFSANGMNVPSGDMEIEILLEKKREYPINLPSVVIGVRGTILQIMVDPENQIIKVLEGEITVSRKGSRRSQRLRAGGTFFLNPPKIEVNNVETPEDRIDPPKVDVENKSIPSAESLDAGF